MSVIPQFASEGVLSASRRTSPWLTIKEAAEYLVVSASFVKQRVSRNEIPHRHLGRSVRIHVEELNRWADSKPGTRVEELT